MADKETKPQETASAEAGAAEGMVPVGQRIWENPNPPASAEEAHERAEALEQAIAARPETQEYLVLIQIGGAGDPEIWRPGSRIALDDYRARLHLAAGNVRPLDDTEPPPDPITVQIVHDAPLPEPRRKPSPKRSTPAASSSESQPGSARKRGD